MKLVLLARHGTHDEVGRVLSGRSDIALNQDGRSQAEALSVRLAGQPIASIHSSPRARTRETAAVVANDRGLEVTIAPALDEIDFGDFAGRRFDELDTEPEWQRWNAERGTAECPNGETMIAAVDRADAYLASISSDDAPALCVSHCDIIRGIMARHLSLGLDHLLQLQCEPGSVTALTYEGSTARVLPLLEPAQ